MRHVRIFPLSRLMLAAVAVLSGTAGTASETTGPGSDRSHLRTRLDQAGVALQWGWTNELAHAARGGTRSTTRNAGQLVLDAVLDLDRLVGWQGARVQVTLDTRYGENLGDAAGLGTAMSVHEIYGRGQTWWLTHLYLDQSFANDRLSLRLGKMPAGSDFGYDECHFLNLTACGSAAGNLEGRYWYNWPIGSWGMRAQWRSTQDTTFKLGAYQVNDHYVDDAWARGNGWKPINPSGTRGALIPVEFSWMPRLAGQPGQYRLGAWLSTAGGDDLYLNAEGLPIATDGGVPLHRDRSHGAYLSFKQQLTGDADGNGVHAFLNLIRADSRTARYDRQIAAGLRWQGLPWRHADSAGVMVGITAVSARYSDHARQWNRWHPDAWLDPLGGAEKAAEVFYQWVPAPAVSVRPSVQYVLDPSGSRVRGDAVVIGLKTDIAF